MKNYIDLVQILASKDYDEDSNEPNPVTILEAKNFFNSFLQN